MAAEKRRYLLVTIVAVLLVASIALPVSGQEYTRGEPEISAYAPENEVVPGTESTVQIQLQNDGSVDVGTQTDVVTTARGVTVEVDDEGPFDVKTEQTALGPIQDGAAVTTDLRLAVPDDLEAGTYDVSLNVRYSHTRSISPQTERVNERSRLQNLEVTIVVTDDARFSIEDVQSDLQAGMSGTSEIEFENVGNQPAFDARATITGGNGLRFGEGATDVFIGDLEPGDSATVEVDTTLENGALEGAVPVEAAFEFEDAAGVSREAPPIVSGFPTAPKPTVRIENVQTSLAVGQDGHIRGTIHNDGPTAVTDGVLVIDPASESISVSEPQIALPELESGESAAFEYDATVSSDTAGGMRQAQFSVQYANGGPVSVETDPVAQRIPVDEKLSFSIATLEDTLAVGYSGTISGALRNDGPRSVSDAVLVIEPVSDSIAIDERRFALPELDAGETTAFAYQTDISGQADAGPRQVRFTVEYGGDGTEPVRVGPLNERVVVDTQRAEFSVTGVQTRVSAGGTTDLVLEITNERPETLSNVNAKLFTDSPFDSDSDEAFVDELEPGASAEIVFSLSAEEDVMPKAYPVELDFQYDTERGDSVLSDTYQQSVTVTEPDDTDSGLPFGSILTSIGVLLLVGGAVGLAYMIRVRE